jgi:hypothetical protein
LSYGLRICDGWIRLHQMVFSRLPSSCLPSFLIQQLVRVVPNPTYATNT